jgi:hypothetical protein
MMPYNNIHAGEKIHIRGRWRCFLVVVAVTDISSRSAAAASQKGHFQMQSRSLSQSKKTRSAIN